MKKKDLERRLFIIEEKLGINDQESNLVVGKWYKYPEYENWKLCITSIDGNDVRGYGVNLGGNWMRLGKWDVIEDDLDELIECTPQEVEEALIREAQRRGIVDECVINDSNICGFEAYNYKIHNFVGYVMDAVVNELRVKQKKNSVENFRTIFKDGVWAEVRVGEPFFKPEEELKVNDVCKFWNYDERYFEIAKLVRIYGEKESYRYASAASSWRNAKTLTKQEVIKLLFGDEENEY